MLSRRSFINVCGAAGAVMFLTKSHGQPVQPQRFFEWKGVGKGANAAFGYGGNALVLRGKDGLVLVDCKNAPWGATLRDEAESVGGAKLAAVINTHHHADHTGGNHALVGDVPSYAHEKATPRILGQMNRYISQAKEAATATEGKTGEAVEAARRQALAYYKSIEQRKATDFAPRTGVGDRHTLDAAGLKVELYHFGAGHTDNDMVVHVPSLNVLHTGDLVFHKLHPYVDRDSGATTSGWMESVRRAVELCDPKTVVVPGHGELTDTAGLRAQIAYFETMREAVQKAITAGKSRKETAEADPGVFSEYGKSRRDMVLAAIYDELTAGK